MRLRETLVVAVFAGVLSLAGTTKASAYDDWDIWGGNGCGRAALRESTLRST